MPHAPKDILLVTGMSGAGKSTVLRTLEDLGWEVVDNLPLVLLERLLASPLPDGTDSNARPLAIGFGAATRGFEPERIVKRIKQLRDEHGHDERRERDQDASEQPVPPIDRAGRMGRGRLRCARFRERERIRSDSHYAFLKGDIIDGA